MAKKALPIKENPILQDKELYPEYSYPVEPNEDPANNAGKTIREPIQRLGKAVTDRIPQMLGIQKVTMEDPEYWGMNIMYPTDDECELCLVMGKRKPRVYSEIVALCKENDATKNFSEEYIQQMLDELSYTGGLEWNYENEAHEKQWVLPMFVPGSAEFSNMNLDLITAHPEVGNFFERMTRLPLEMVTQFVPDGGAGIGMHVIPVEKEVNLNNETSKLEHISYWLDKYEGKYAASPCSCRRSRQTHDEACADDPEGWCIAMGDMADYVVETNKGGHYITRERALEIFEDAEKLGFVHQITNIDGEDKIFAICNCNVNVCYALRTSQLFNTPNMSRSAYVAHVDKEKCVACGKCVEVCPAGAPTLGQKLPLKDGTQVEYPIVELPWVNEAWGESHWTHNYKDVNRINTHTTGTAPCKSACPAHIAIQGYINMIKDGRYDEALALIKQDNPLPAICGRICNKRCEDACTRGTVDEALAIDFLKRFVADRDMNAETRYIPEKLIPSQDKTFFENEKIAIIGAGPAGLSCAYYLALKGYKPTVFEKHEKPGGMLAYGIPAFKLENNVIDAEVAVIEELGAEFKYGVEVGKDVTLDELRAQGYKAFYLAIGCQGGKKPGVEGQDAEGVYTAVDFLAKANADEAFPLKGGNVVVVGGGNVAIDAARVAYRCGEGAVSMYCLESAEEMPALPVEIAEAKDDTVTINNGWGPKEILVEDGKVTGVVFKKCLSVFDENHRFSPKYDENDTITVECTDVIFSVGQAIVWGDLLKGSKVELGRGNGAVANKLTYQTAEPDIFVGGDVYTGPKFAIDAIAAGREAAISIHRYVQPNCTLTIGRDRRDFIELDKNDLTLVGYDESGRNVPERDASYTTKAFKEYDKVFTEEQAAAEAKRCLKCGASIVDPNKCIGCGLCTQKCKFDAIHLKRDIPAATTMRNEADKLKYIIPNMAKYPAGLAVKKLKAKVSK